MRNVKTLSLVLTNNEVKKLLHGTPEEHSQVIQELEEKLSNLVENISSTETVVSLTVAHNTPLIFFKRILAQWRQANNGKNKEQRKNTRRNSKNERKKERKNSSAAKRKGRKGWKK